MKIDSLGNCPSTLLPDPMRVDADSFRGYINATAQAGFDEVSLWAFHLMLAGPQAANVVLDSGLSVRAVEAAISWASGPSDAARAEVAGLVETGSQFGAHIVGAACLGPIEDQSAAADGLAMLAEVAATADMVIALEFLPWAGVPTFSAANDLVVASGAENATVLIDAWHWVRQPGGPDLDLLRSVPGERVAYVQMCDPGPAPGEDLETEAMNDRRLPGAGTVDYASLWSALDHIGSSVFVAAEVFNPAMTAKGPVSMAAAVHDACWLQLP
ncbi:MAG: sugar phosphate isomerase/epimerase [Acidimicrobiaceae bacterium]|nr:sugar phosphate isomerase/epimerase [Acidimicrobiaceae bacterium]